MEKATRSREKLTLRSGKTQKMIAEEDIRRRAFEIFKQNEHNAKNELENWLRAERELKGDD